MGLAANVRRARLITFVAPQAAAGISPGPHAITEIETFPVREPVSRRAYTVVRVKTRSGLTGYGECLSVTPADLAHARQIAVGRPATSYEAIRGLMASAPSLRAGVNIALLDIVGKVTKAPVHRVLGGPTRFKVRVMTTLEGETDEALAASMKAAAASGFRAFVVPITPPASRNQGQAFVIAVRKRMEMLRSSDAGADFVLEARDGLTPGDAASIATALERFHLLWFDEPCAVSNLNTVHKISGETVTPVGFGRNIHNPGVFQDLLRDGLVDIVRPELSWGGISQTRRIAAIAEPYYTAIAPRHEGGPILTAAAIQLAACLPNFFIQHVPFPASEEDRRMRGELVSGAVEGARDGFAGLPTDPGLGITVSENALAKYKDTQA